MADFGKSFGYAKKSIMAYVGIWLVAAVLELLPVVALLGGLIGTLQFWIINPILLAYAGYVAAKAGKGKPADGAMAGAVAGLVGSVVVAVLSVILVAVGFGSNAIAGQDSAATAGMGALVTGAMGVVQLMMVVIITVAGAVLGAIGALFAQSQAKKK